MSHVTTRKSCIKDLPTLQKAIARIPGAQYMGVGTGRTYSSQSKGWLVQLPGWNYPVTIDPKTGQCSYDNYGGRWGDEKHLDALNQGYAVEAAKAQAELSGHDCEEIKLEDGGIKLVIPLGGGYEVAGGGETEGGYGV